MLSQPERMFSDLQSQVLEGAWGQDLGATSQQSRAKLNDGPQQHPEPGCDSAAQHRYCLLTGSPLGPTKPLRPGSPGTPSAPI